MPVQRCQRGGRAGHKWGKAGFCYVGPDSREKAAAQGRAIQARRADKAINMKPPKGVVEEFKRGVRWYEEGHGGSGLVPATIRWARRLARGEAITAAKVRKMRAWLARHEVDKKGEGFKPGEKGFPSPGRVAWALWGGDPAVTWSAKLVRQLERKDARAQRMDATAAPRGLERDYRVMMTRRLRDLAKVLDPVVRAELAKRLDAAEEEAAALQATIAGVERRWVVDVPPPDADVLRIAGQVDSFTTRKTARTVERVVPIDVSNVLANAGTIRPMHERWVANNLELIQRLEQRHFADVSKFITRAVQEGKSTREVTKVLSQRLGVSRRRANLIARNEIGTLNAEITRARMTDLGIKRFRWVDSGDDVVRPLHQEINGQVFDYPNGHPTEGLPGEPINCRCTAEPVL